MRTESSKVLKVADPEMSTASKVAQIKSGAKNKRSTGAEGKDIVITGKDGSKIIQRQKEEKFEETAVLRKKKNYVMYEAKLGTETTTDITKIDAPMKKEKKPVREPEARVEEKIVQKKKKKEYLDNYQYHETKDIKNPNPRYQVIVEHQRLGDIIGGTFEETSYERQVFSQGSNRPQITEKSTTVTKTGSAVPGTLKGNKSQITTMKKTVISGASSSGPSLPQTTSSKRTTTTTTSTTRTAQKGPNTATGGKEKVTETTVKRRNEGTGSKTETRTQSQTTRTGGAEGTSSTSTKTTTKVTDLGPGEKTASSSTTTTTKTVSKSETNSGTGGEVGSSVRKKYSRFSKH